MDIAVDLNACIQKNDTLPKWHYDIIADNLFRPELGRYHTYGVQVSTPEYTDRVHDVSLCKKTTENIVELLNHHQVSPLHLHDIVTDMLSESSSATG